MSGPEPSADRLALLYRVSQKLNSSLDLDEVLNRVIDEVIAATRAERGFLMLRDTDGAMIFRTARGIDQQTIAQPEFEVSRGVIERVAHEGRPLLTSNAQSDERLRARESVTVLGLRAILCVPLQIKGEVIGVVYVDNRLQSGIFTESDLELLTSIASSAAVAVDNARLYQVAVEKGRLERELQVAREVQVSLLPRDTPRLAGWEFAARWQPARQVAGDFYDFVAFDQGLGLVIADVTDKGMPAALFMALTRSIVRASLTGAGSVVDGIVQANRLICADAANSMFVTLFCAQVNSATGEVHYVNAGHNPPLVYQAGRRDLLRLTNTGMALGLFVETPFEQRTVQLDSGGFVLLYTDGVSEAMSAAREEFGEERIGRVLIENAHASAEDLAMALERALSAHIGARAPSDDITFVIAKRLSSSRHREPPTGGVAVSG